MSIRNGAYYPERFLIFLYDLLESEDIDTLQEYLGYCLIPSTKGQAMLFLIGNGGEGKSRIDFEHNIISVRRTSNYTAERGTYTDTTKTKRSQRTLKISPFIMDLLRELKEEQDDQALKIGDKLVETDRLFTKWDGSEMNNQTPYGWLKEFCKKNDLPFYGLHSFRHFAASALIFLQRENKVRKLRQRTRMQNKGQIKDKTEFQAKRKLSNGYFKPFESSVDGDPYGNRIEFFKFRNFARY